MSVFDAEVSVYSTSISTPTKELLDQGAPPVLDFGVTTGMALPFQNPETGQPLVIPVGRMTFSFSREQAIETFSAALEAAEKLPEKPASSGKIMLASSMAEVEGAASKMQKVTGR